MEYRYATKSTEELVAELKRLKVEKRQESSFVGQQQIVAEMRVITKILQKRGK